MVGVVLRLRLCVLSRILVPRLEIGLSDVGERKLWTKSQGKMRVGGEARC